MHEQDPSNVSTSSSMICLYITTLGFGLPTELVTLPIVAVLLWLQHERCLVFVILLLVVGSIRLLSGIPVILSRWESKSLEKRATQDPNDVRLGPLDRHERCLVWFNLGLIGSIAGLVGLFYWEDLVVRLVITGLIGATWLGLIGGLGIWAWTLHQLFD